MNKQKKSAVVSGLSALALMGGQAFAVNTWGFDTTTLMSDVTSIGTLLVAVAAVILSFRVVRRMIAR